jgi:nucleoside-diphosphate-sugar epimerase
MQILRQLLQKNYSVRVISRSVEKGEALKANFKEYSQKIEVSKVEDQLADGAYDEAAKGVDYIIHTASPFIMNAKDVKAELLTPAVKMATNMLSAAHKSNSAKRVVLTSSLAAIVDPFAGGLFADVTYTGDSWNPLTEEQIEGPVLGYLGSKKLAEKAAWDYVKTNKTSFDLVTICPSLIVGQPLQEVKSMSKLNTSNMSIYGLFDAKEVPQNQFPYLVHVDEVAQAHIASLEVKEAGGKRFILSGDRYSFQYIIDAIRTEFPRLKDRMCTGNTGVDENDGKTLARLDVSPAEKILGIKFQKWHEAVIKGTVPYLLDLEKRLS